MTLRRESARARELNRILASAHLHVPTDTYEFHVKPANATAIRTLLRGVVEAVDTGDALEEIANEFAKIEDRSPGEPSIKYRMRASIPSNCFIRVDVARHVLIFGRTDDVAPVHLVIFLEQATSTGAG